MKSNEIYAEYLDHMGTDLTVVNAARASFGKESDWVHTFAKDATESHAVLSENDVNLIRFLATGYRTKDWKDFIDQIINAAINSPEGTKEQNLTALLHDYKKKAQHWAPFAHPHIQIRIQIPIFLARQFVKHQVGGVWSEESRRYISNEPNLWLPTEWHSRPEDIKQGSGERIDNQIGAKIIARISNECSVDTYKDLMGYGVAPEEARIVLPLNMMTTVVWTGSLLFWTRVYNQRVDSHAQKAANDLAEQIGNIIKPLFPVSWEYLT